jgi:hypothetical protein
LFTGNEQLLKIIKPLLDLRLFETFGDNRQHTGKPVSLDRLNLFPTGMAV